MNRAGGWLFVLACVARMAEAGAGEPVVSEDVLKVECEQHAADPTLPWALAHGVTAFGKKFRASDGRLAIDAMVDDYLQVENAGGGKHYVFPPAVGGRPVEPHPNLLVKTMVGAGVPMSQRFKLRAGATVTLGQLVDDVMTRFRYEPSSDEFWQSASWTVAALGERLSPGRATFKTDQGKVVDFNQVVAAGFDDLEQLGAVFEDAMARGRPTVNRAEYGIYLHACGGFHLIQALMQWFRFPEVRRAMQPRFDRQMRILFYRLGSEQLWFEDAVVRAPQFRSLYLLQSLNFYGHWLETMGRLVAAGAFSPDAKQLREIVRARLLLVQTAARLDREGAFKWKGPVAGIDYETYLRFVGDSCHAHHGWQLTAFAGRSR